MDLYKEIEYIVGTNKDTIKYICIDSLNNYMDIMFYAFQHKINETEHLIKYIKDSHVFYFDKNVIPVLSNVIEKIEKEDFGFTAEECYYFSKALILRKDIQVNNFLLDELASCLLSVITKKF
jgi:hypothetical protein